MDSRVSFPSVIKAPIADQARLMQIDSQNKAKSR